MLEFNLDDALNAYQTTVDDILKEDEEIFEPLHEIDEPLTLFVNVRSKNRN